VREMIKTEEMAPMREKVPVREKALMRYGVDIFSPSSWEPQEEGMMSIAARFSLS
jgi:hypothetical protein